MADSQVQFYIKTNGNLRLLKVTWHTSLDQQHDLL